MADQNSKKIEARLKAQAEEGRENAFEAPRITREPTSRQARLGGKVVIRIIAEGKPLPSYQWFHNGQKITGATMDRLTLPKLRRIDAGTYHCEVKNYAGKATSRICILSFFTQEIPKLVVGPDRAKVEEGKPATLKVLSPPLLELKEYKVYWMFNGMRIKGAHGPVLKIAAMKKKYEGEYKAMIATGGIIETSNMVQILLSPSASEPLPQSLDVIESIPKEPEAPAPAQHWEPCFFNPESEESESEEPPPPLPATLSPDLNDELLVSQLGTKELIREVMAHEDGDALIEMLEEEDPAGIAVLKTEESHESEFDPIGTSHAPTGMDFSYLMDEPLADPVAEPWEEPRPTIEPEIVEQALPLLPTEKKSETKGIDLSEWIEEFKAEEEALAAKEESLDATRIIDWSSDTTPPPVAIDTVESEAQKNQRSRLVEKKQFLENLLDRFQAQFSKKPPQAA